MKNKLWKPQLPKFRKHKKKLLENIITTGQFIHMIGESDLLRQVSREVTDNELASTEFQQKIAYLKKCMLKFRKLTGLGRGITGVQVGIPLRVAVIYLPRVLQGKAGLPIKEIPSTFDKELMIIINPVITKKSESLLLYPEVCMSANPIIAPVVRPARIEFSYIDEQGNKQYWQKKDGTKETRIYNRVFQHEIDHMDGIINIDNVQSNELIFDLDPHFYEKATFTQV